MKEMVKKLIANAEIPYGFTFVFEDGERLVHKDGSLFTLYFKNKAALRDIFARGGMGFGEQYMAGNIDVEGDLQEVSRLSYDLLDTNPHLSMREYSQMLFLHLTRKNTLKNSQKNISHHYDLGNDFYSLVLDKKYMQYTCAYFEDERDSIEKSQEQKLEHVARKLRLEPGQTIVEAGSGWGGLARYFAKKYDVKVLSFNISKEQVAYAREKAEKEKLKGQVEYILDDYRNIPNYIQKADRFVSVGMMEHVGKENYSKFYQLIKNSTKENGVALVHSIAKVRPKKTAPWLAKYIFPGSYMPSLSEMVQPVEKFRPLHVVDVENLRYHYALTLDHWTDSFEKHVGEIRKQYGENFERMFRLYLRASAASFRYGGILLYQLVLVNGYDDAAPLTRRHFYDSLVKTAKRTTSKPAAKKTATAKKTAAKPATKKAPPKSRGARSK